MRRERGNRARGDEDGQAKCGGAKHGTGTEREKPVFEHTYFVPLFGDLAEGEDKSGYHDKIA
jgi:hypothetical protein